MRTRSNLFKGMSVKHIGYYANNCGLKPEKRFSQVTDYLAKKFEKVEFTGPKDVVHIFATSYGFLIALLNGNIRVTDVQVNEFKDSSWTPVEEDWVLL